MTIRNFIRLSILIIPLATFALSNCSKERSLLPKQVSTCNASECHASSQLNKYPPQSGKHALHLVNGLICENCHKDYDSNPKHKNGVVDISSDTGAVKFDTYSSAGKWFYSSGECSNLECHGGGSVPVKWYGDVPGGCTVCHSEGSPIDPLLTSGEGMKGKHIAHVVNQNINCDSCHYDYKKNSGHMNNIYGKNEVVSIVNYDGIFKNSNVSFTFNDNTGLCENISCHGTSIGIGWYSDTSGCMACHSSSNINPIITNGSGASGKHVEHVTNRGIECVSCHYDYKNNSRHMNGQYGHAEPGLLVFFGGKWPSNGYNVSAAFNNPNPGYCSAISCHGGTGYENWYASSSASCVNSCHAAGSRIGPSPIDASTGSHPGHISSAGISCEECHSGYRNLLTHINGTLDIPAANPGMLKFNPSRHPSGGYSAGQCSGIYCHGSFTGGNSSIYPVWGGMVNCATNACHGSDASGNPAESNNPDTKHGTHVTAITNITNPGTGSKYTKTESCPVCHSGHGYGTGTHVNSQADITFNYQNPEGAMGTSTGGNWTLSGFSPVQCQNTYCHGNFSGGNIDTVSWAESKNDSGWCGSCHSANPISVKHAKHLAVYPGQCVYCHEGYTAASTSENHVNLIRDVSFGYPIKENTGGMPDYENASKTCSYVYCHGYFPRVMYNATTTNPGNANNPIWNSSSAALCGTCHGNAGNNYSSATHSMHTRNLSGSYKTYFGNPIGIESCDACHNFGTDSDKSFTASSTQGSYNTVNHGDFSISDSGVNADVLFKADDSDLASRIGDIVPAKTTWNPGSTSCSNSWCHGNFDNGAGFAGNNATNTPNWLVPSTGDCLTCHSYYNGTHSGGFSCTGCHPMHGGGFSPHINGIFGGF